MSVNTSILFVIPVALLIVRALRRFFDLPTRMPRWNGLLSWIWLPGALLYGIAVVFRWKTDQLDEMYLLLVFMVVLAVLLRLQTYRPARTLLLAMVPYVLYSAIELELELTGGHFLKEYDDAFDTSKGFALIWLFTFVLIARNQKKQLEKERLEREEEEKAKRLIEAQNAELERLVGERTATLTKQAEELREALTELKITQNQLIQSEKMASLGELTAGIAHEIQNPLNFVTNFSDVSAELIDELDDERQSPTRDPELEAELLNDLKKNLQKITHHGQRAASIVRGMLEHSRASTGERQEVDLNTLADEYLRLAYHGLRAKDKSFNATLVTDFDLNLGKVEAVSQDLGRVLLNLFTNAFYAVQKKKECCPQGYTPTVSVSTRHIPSGEVEVRVRDNGTGIPVGVQQKIFQPFFTTKPTGEGTGLGLSLSYDIITKGHGGTLTLETNEGEGTEFIITLPPSDGVAERTK
ncbi:His Kinase A (phospho-acceptor) domain-containing protein [Hymenobacter gelipurpurascens]|uniref:histidine kinase n=1 Tax=Hymenobacter gelipurpurascens TaxID=89968 RepID=A0A212T9S8_9BACT|nr:ATP-binding protein [Hymenobacter gelipurpurascens]SNC62745.1 His Kinase A (phospho-acceptor) domain-containing protein [Hymenobacter gelipurpurascens]